MEKINIAIDGPAGAGKSTVAKLVAKKLGFLYIDTGAMYRALTLKALEVGIDLNDAKELSALAFKTTVNLKESAEGLKVFLDERDVSLDIRSPLVSQNVSLVAKVSGVREKMVSLQREMASHGGVVMDGRDIGTFVLPDAHKKFFLTASLEERANRRYMELKEQGYSIDFEELIKDIADRDKLDQEREIAPLIQAVDAILIDTTGLSIDGVVAEIIGCTGGKM